LCIVFSFKNNFFLRETRDGFEGVQRRGHVKGAVCPRSSQTLDREHRWNNAGFVRRGLSGEKNGEKTASAKNTEWENGCGLCGIENGDKPPRKGARQRCDKRTTDK
jgi:hypothetical protein